MCIAITTYATLDLLLQHLDENICNIHLKRMNIRLQHVLIYLLPPNKGSLTRSSVLRSGAEVAHNPRTSVVAARGKRESGRDTCGVKRGGAQHEAQAEVRGARCGGRRVGPLRKDGRPEVLL